MKKFSRWELSKPDKEKLDVSSTTNIQEESAWLVGERSQAEGNGGRETVKRSKKGQ